MPKQKDIRSLLQRQIKDLTKKLTESRANLAYYESVVGQQSLELTKLENALASLDGKLPAPHHFLSGMSESKTIQELSMPAEISSLSPSVFGTNIGAPRTVMIGDEPVIVEPGFHVEKNSFGEDCIVPDGVAHAPAAEPAPTPDTSILFKGAEAALPLPAITSGEEFDSPEDIISGELPNG